MTDSSPARSPLPQDWKSPDLKESATAGRRSFRRCRAARTPTRMPPTRQALLSRSSGVCGNPPSPCGVKPCIRSRTGGAEVENLLIVFVQDVFAARKHFPVLVDLVLGIEIDAGIGVDLAGLAG